MRILIADDHDVVRSGLSTILGGQPGWEKWHIDGKDGEVNAVVAKRYILSVQGRNVEDIKVLHDVVGKLDLARLAAMK